MLHANLEEIGRCLLGHNYFPERYGMGRDGTIPEIVALLFYGTGHNIKCANRMIVILQLILTPLLNVLCAFSCFCHFCPALVPSMLGVVGRVEHPNKIICHYSKALLINNNK